jgi:hypothetical protein
MNDSEKIPFPESDESDLLQLLKAYHEAAEKQMKSRPWPSHVRDGIRDTWVAAQKMICHIQAHSEPFNRWKPKQVSCKACHQEGLQWTKDGDKWRLEDADGAIHACEEVCSSQS